MSLKKDDAGFEIVKDIFTNLKIKKNGALPLIGHLPGGDIELLKQCGQITL